VVNPADGQVTEIMARNLLVSALVGAGIEVARPERDRGVDLVAYLDLDDSHRFVAAPIQLKGSAGTGVTFQRKYESFQGLVTVLAWNVRSLNPSFYALTQLDIDKIAHDMGWDTKHSWTREPRKTAGWHVSTTKGALADALKPHAMRGGMDWEGVLRRSAV
jgi:hypothetical protein